MTPSKHAKSLGAKSLLEVSEAYDMHKSSLMKIHNVSLPRFEYMVKVHVLAKQMEVDTKHLNFMLESVVGSMKKSYVSNYFIEDESKRVELVQAYIVDFNVKMSQMCQQLILNEQAKSDFREVIYNLLKG